MRDGGERGVPRPEPPGPGDRADNQRGDVGRPGLAGDTGGEVAQAPAVEPMREQGRRGPGEDVEEEVETGVGGDVEQLGAFQAET
jgi:hypothetical protein